MPPSLRPPLGGTRPRGVHAGGTTAEEGRTGVSRWLAPLIGLAVLGGLVVLFFIHGDSSDPRSEPTQATEIAARPVRGIEPGPVSVGLEKDDEGVEDDRVTGEDAVRQIAKELDRARVWSNVTVDGDTLTIHSGDCDTPTMSQILAANQPVLVAAGIGTIRCLERHGALAFERVVGGVAPDPSGE